MNLLDELTLEDLKNEQYELAELIGIEAYKTLVYNYAGSSIYVPKVDTLINVDRQDKIRSEFDGYNFRELALKYDVSERTIRRIVSEDVKKLRATPPDEQISFEEF